ncbi:hypothetical protein [Halosegnis marinus]|uniref:DUF7979 domain-containing protein n=1 Tax=Halosegnis marinus TaxID=3034023 RepID=A0ABD5ZLR1_9EURY|nr:hypothetical protein [Halosegnis sp. DT85]
MRRALLLLGLCVLLAGCAGLGGQTTPSPSETPEQDPTPTVTATETPVVGSPTPTPTVTPSSANTVAWRDLSAAAREAFRTSYRPNGLAVFVPESPYIDGETFAPSVAEPFAEHDFVRRNGTLYRVRLDTGELYASYGVDVVAEDPGGANVTAFANLTAEHRRAVRAAVENGTYRTDLGEPTTVSSLAGEYVRYEGEVYRVRVTVGDYWARLLRVEAV